MRLRVRLRVRRKRQAFLSRLLEYDASKRRVWIVGQRCHHGATGSVVVSSAFAVLIAGRVRTASFRRPPLAMALAGSALMAHDWKDRSSWFERGRQGR